MHFELSSRDKNRLRADEDSGNYSRLARLTIKVLSHQSATVEIIVHICMKK
jgi:hypothetical protein